MDSPRLRNGYSFRAAAGSISDVMDRLKEVGATYAPITDRASTFGWVRWSKAAKLAGLIPVFGVELGVTDSVSAKKPNVDHWTFIAQEDLGPINRLVSTATRQFRYQPLLTYEQAQSAQGVFKIAGHKTLFDNIEPGTLFGLGPSTSRGYYRTALERGMIPVAAGDNRFVRESDRGFYEVAIGRSAETQSYPQHILTREEWARSIDRLDIGTTLQEEALDRSYGLLAQSTASLQRAELVHPDRPDTLKAMCELGARRIGCPLENPIYRARMERELSLIVKKDYEDYFYLVADICQWARSRMIVGPARGSSCGSLVCYLLGITTVDPIPHGLIFERFIDINRDDLPDIDIDFSDQQRHQVFAYINDKYGAENVARLGTVSLFKARSALKEASAALRIPPWKVDAVASSLIERSGGDARALDTLEDTLNSLPAGKELLEKFPEIMVASRMEGHPRHHSQHAAGIVIAARPISDIVAVDERTGATMCDKIDAEDLNLLKIDALGLTQLSVFEDVLDFAGLPYDTLEKIPLDDPAAFAILNDRSFAGIFQWNGAAVQSVTTSVKMESFDDIVAITALARPGPSASGGTNEWVKRKNGKVPIAYIHPVFEPYLSETLGIVIYQEQVMEIARNIGGLSWGDVTALRKAMSKSLGVEFFNQYGDRWKTAAISKGVRTEDATKVWDDLCAYGSWSFNKSHATAYGMISYWCCWLKAHHPFEFAAATLSHETDPERQMSLLREMVREGYDYVPVEADTSTLKWGITVRGANKAKTLVGPLSMVKGIGPKLSQQILHARSLGEPMPRKALKLLSNPKTDIDSLWPIRDAFKKHLPDPSSRNIHTPPVAIEDIREGTTWEEVLVFCVISNINPRDENESINVAKRGGVVITDGKTSSLNLRLTDDTDTIFAKIGRFDYDRLGKEILERGRVRKCLYAIKGKVPPGSFRMISVKQARFIGDIDEEQISTEASS